MADIKQLKVEDRTYDIKDEESRKVLAQLTDEQITSDDTTTHKSISSRIDEKITEHNKVFTGATSSTDGLQGHVPSPSMGDENKYLKGNGEWASALPSYSSGNALDNTTPVSGQFVNNLISVRFSDGQISPVFTTPDITDNSNTGATTAFVHNVVTNDLRQYMVIKGVTRGGNLNATKVGDTWVVGTVGYYDTNGNYSSSKPTSNLLGRVEVGDFIICVSLEPKTYTILQTNIHVGNAEGDIPQLNSYLGNLENVPIVTTTDGKIKSHSSGALGDSAFKNVTDSSSASAISTSTNIPTERDIYYGLPNINGAHNYSSNTNYYVATSTGTNGQVLISDGSNTPRWTNQSELKVGALQNSNNKMTVDLLNVILFGSSVSDYNANTSYTTNSLAFYNGRLYRCKGSTSGSWDSTAWEDITGKLVGATASKADTLTTGNTGSASKPVYFSNGVPVECTSIDLNATSATNATNATYMQNSTYSIGATNKPVYFYNGVPVECDSYDKANVNYATSAGSATNATTAQQIGTDTIGNSTTPVYIDNGVPTTCTSYANASVNYASNAGKINGIEIWIS